MNCLPVHNVLALTRARRNIMPGIRALCIALLISTAPIAKAFADCPAAPIGSADDLVVSFLAANGAQVASSTLLPSSVKEGMLVYDDADDTLKICDGDSWIEVGSGGSVVPAGNDGSIQFKSGSGLAADAANLHWDDATNRLGIGTATPGRSLDVAGIIAAAGIGAPYTTDSWARPIEFNHGSAIMWKKGAASESWGIGKTNTPASALSIFTSSADDNSAAAVPKMTVLANGNVGVGTTAPAVALDVRGAIRVSNLSFQNASGTVYPSNWIGPASNIDGLNNVWLHIGGITDNTDGTGDQRRLSLHGNLIYLSGNVGIGTTAPQSRLQVAGGIQLANDADACPGTGSTKLGTLKYLSNTLSVCNTTGWAALASGSGITALTGDVTASGTGSVATTIANNAVTTAKIANSNVTFAKIQNSAAAGLSVIGRAANSAGAFAEISASATDHSVLRRSGTVIGFGAINLASADAVTGVLAPARMGTGTPSASNFLRGDGSWQAVPAGTVTGTGAANHIAYWSGASAVAHDASQLVWNATDNRLGVGVASPSYAIDTNGTVRAAAYQYTSDRNLKADVETVSGLDIVTRLHGVSFRWKENGQPATGVIAQEVEAVLPAAVGTDDYGIKSVDYLQMIGPMIEAIKELKADNDNLRAEIESLKHSAGEAR